MAADELQDLVAGLLAGRLPLPIDAAHHVLLDALELQLQGFDAVVPQREQLEAPARSGPARPTPGRHELAVKLRQLRVHLFESPARR